MPVVSGSISGVHAKRVSRSKPALLFRTTSITAHSRTPMEAPLAKKPKKEGSASNYSPQDDCEPQPTAQPPPEPSPGVGKPQVMPPIALQMEGGPSPRDSTRPHSGMSVEQVLNTFRQRFIADVDADAIVYELAHQGIISDADLEELTATKGAKQKNQFLYRCLMKKNTKVSLLKVCSIMIEEEGNPRMKQFGRDLEKGIQQCPSVEAQDPVSQDVEASPILPEPLQHVQKHVYRRYKQLSLREGQPTLQFTKVAVLQNAPKPEKQEDSDQDEFLKRFRDCGVRLSEGAEQVTVSHFLRKGSHQTRIIYGQPGTGKTTFLKHLCQRVADDEASDFSLVLYFPLREKAVSEALKNDSDAGLEQLMQYYIRGKKSSASTEALLETEGAKVLIIFDGADEVRGLIDSLEGSLLGALLEGRVLPQAHFIVSTRPGGCPLLQQHSTLFYEILGFDKEAVIVINFDNALQAALAKGRVEAEMVKCVTLGPTEAGKTQLKRALIGKFDRSCESTPMSTGAEAVMQCYVHGKNVWEPLTRETLRKSLHTTVNMMEQMEPDSTKDKSNQDEKDSSSPKQSLSKSLSLKSEVPKGQGVLKEVHTVSTGVHEDEKNPLSLKSEVPEGHGVVKKVQPVSTGMHEGPTSTSKPRADSKKALLQKQFAALKASVEEGLKETDPAGVEGLDKIRIVHLIDSGGQPAFFDIHPVIATSRAVYLLVYNMEEGLNHKPPNRYRKKEFPTKQLPNAKQSNLDMIKNSLVTIHDCKQKFITLESELHRWFGSLDSTSSASALPVLVVGTRKRDKETITSESEKLEKECSYLPVWHKVLHCEDTGTNMFAVECTDHACQGVQSVHKEINRAGCTYKLPLPVSWFFCQLIFWSAHENLHVVTFDNLQELCQQEGLITNPDEFLAMVRAFHLLGIISFPYFDQELSLGDQWKPDDEPVFTNPDVLYQQTTKILEVVYRDLEKTSMEPDAREGLTRLQSSGQLDTDTLDFLGIPDELGSYNGFHAYLLERMVHWGLAAKRTSEGAAGTGRPTYFIPSCLPACEEEPVIFTEASLAFTFCLPLADGKKFHYVPRGIFPHMVVKAEGMGYAIPENTEDDGSLYRDIAVFSIEPSRSDKIRYAYNVTVVDKMDHVTISIDPADVSKKKSSPTDCRQIVSDLKHAMEATYNRIYYTSLDVTVVSKCRCDRRGAPASHLAMIVCCKDGHSDYVMQCLLPRRTVWYDCPPEIAALLCDQGPDQAPDGSSGAVAQTEVIPKGVAGSPFSVSQFLEAYEDEFLEVANPKLSLLKLKHKGVISADVRTAIESANDEDAKYILLEHLQKNATVETLRVYCDVATAANGYSRMQELGKKMIDGLPPEGK